MKATKVFLRAKDISKGRKSLYLDFYPAIPHPETGKPTRREFLGLYIHKKPRTEAETQHNKQTKALAENIRASRQLELQAQAFGQASPSKLKADFVEYFRGQVESKTSSVNTYDTWKNALHHIEQFWPNGIKFKDMDKGQAEAFRAYLEGAGLAQNSQSLYLSKFRSALKKGFKDGYLAVDVRSQFDAIPLKETKKEFVTLEELKALAKTDCPRPDLKTAFIFSALTGLRYSDICALTWGKVRGYEENGWFIDFTQEKTDGIEYHPIPRPARELMGKAGKPERKVFRELKPKLTTWDNKVLGRWFKASGIEKPLTFHSARHSFATIQLTLETDLYTVSKLLGHKSIKTTQVYAKIVDRKKQQATDKLNDFEI